MGTSSGYTESLPAAIQQRIDYLKEMDERKLETNLIYVANAVKAHQQEFDELGEDE